MKRLTLLRHAKSGWDDGVARDFDRPLNAKGVRAAAAIGREMRKRGLAFDHVLASPAQRVIETIAAIEEGYGAPLAAQFDQQLYLASRETLLDRVRAADPAWRSLLLVGHNPGLESLALELAGAGALRDEVAVKYPTGTVAAIDFPVDRWRDVGEGGGEIALLVRPRDLDPAFGPDGVD